MLEQEEHNDKENKVFKKDFRNIPNRYCQYYKDVWIQKNIQ